MQYCSENTHVLKKILILQRSFTGKSHNNFLWCYASSAIKANVHNQFALHLGAASKPFTVKDFLLPTTLGNSSMHFHADLDIAFSSKTW